MVQRYCKCPTLKKEAFRKKVYSALNIKLKSFLQTRHGGWPLNHSQKCYVPLKNHLLVTNTITLFYSKAYCFKAHNFGQVRKVWWIQRTYNMYCYKVCIYIVQCTFSILYRWVSEQDESTYSNELNNRSFS